MAKSPDNGRRPGKISRPRAKRKPSGGVTFKKDTRKANVAGGVIPGVIAASGMGMIKLANPAMAVGFGATLGVRGMMGVLNDAAKPRREKKARAAKTGGPREQSIGPTKSGGFR